MRASQVQSGLYCLSNPKYRLYKKAPEPGISTDGISDIEKRWNLLMNCLSRDMKNGASMLDLSLRHELPYELVRGYVIEWDKKGLLSLVNSEL